MVVCRAMLAWLKRMFGASPRPPAAVSLVVLDEPPQDVQAWCAAVARLCRRDPAMFRQRLPELRARLEAWYEEHPLEVVWGRDYQFRVEDPLRITTDDVVWGEDDLALAPWATLLRSLVVTTGGPNVLHHGCGVTEVLELLRDPSAPEAIVNLSLPHLILDARAELDELVEVLCTSERLRALRHLQFGDALPLDGRHVERLAEAPWAASLQTLDLTEVMVDWSVDRDDAERHGALRALGRLQSLTHLFLYNDIGTVGDLAVLLEATFPALTHLNLGVGPKEPELLALLAETSSLPRLQELCLAGGPPRTDPGWDRVLELPFAVYLHGQRVTATYPNRTPTS